MTYVKQVGGNHYEYGKSTNQHWDLMDRWDIEYLLGCASAYVVRYDRKGTPVEDLGKAMSYIEKQLVCHPNRGARRVMPAEALGGWYYDNPMNNGQRTLLQLIHVDGSTAALTRALYILKEIKDAVNRSQATTAQS